MNAALRFVRLVSAIPEVNRLLVLALASITNLLNLLLFSVIDSATCYELPTRSPVLTSRMRVPVGLHFGRRGSMPYCIRLRLQHELSGTDMA
eukprot:2412066-Rhodomonas_salina.1